MRNGYFILGIVAVVVLIGGVRSADAVHGSCYSTSGQFAWNNISAYGLPPCMAPGYGSMSSGCCPYPAPTCCDNIWAGYCTEGHCFGGRGWCRPSIGRRCTQTVYTTTRNPCSEPECGAKMMPTSGAEPSTPIAKPSPAPVVQKPQWKPTRTQADK